MYKIKLNIFIIKKLNNAKKLKLLIIIKTSNIQNSLNKENKIVLIVAK